MEDPPEEEDDEEEEAKEKDTTVKTSLADPQLVKDKKSSGCSLCNLL